MAELEGDEKGKSISSKNVAGDQQTMGDEVKTLDQQTMGDEDKRYGHTAAHACNDDLAQP